MRSFLSTLILPLPILYLLLFCAFLLLIIRRRKPVRILFVTSLVWLFVISTPFIPGVLIRNLENKYPALTNVPSFSKDQPVCVVVLGAGHTVDPELPMTDQLSEEMLMRLAEGIRIYRQIPGSKLVLSGAAFEEPLTQARVVEKTAIALGVNPKDILRLDYTLNTHIEALEYSRLTGNRGNIILVTDAAHMPRAMKLFRRTGADPIPAPTNHFIKHSLTNHELDWLPSSANIAKMEYAIHEYAGLLWSYIEK